VNFRKHWHQSEIIQTTHLKESNTGIPERNTISLYMGRSNALVATVNMLQQEGKYTEGNRWRKYTLREMYFPVRFDTCPGTGMYLQCTA